MKKILLLSIAVATLFCACKSNKIKGEDPIIVTGVPEIVDYPGLALGKAVPDWVMAIDEGANKKVSKALNLEKDTKIFVVTNKGNDLDFLKTWSDQVDVRAEVQKDRFFVRAQERNLGESAKGIYKNASQKAEIYIRPCKQDADIVLSGEAIRARYKAFLNRLISIVQQENFRNRVIL